MEAAQVTHRLITARQLGEALGLKPNTVLDQWQAGKLPGYKLGRAVRFDLDEILSLSRREGQARGGACLASQTRTQPDASLRVV